MAKFTARLPIIRTDKPMYQKIHGGKKFYFSDKKCAPRFNPLVDKLRKLRKLLKKQKLAYAEESDGKFITFRVAQK